ncbi:hypothetical protein C1S79_19625 [Mycolicibacterium phocaicum]|uniref:Uncharacterized protein n=1 Tax=Mycolicibacterium phocaicum TaxID=319706 RepID=A0AA94R976_9MYCO|nr:hypothetical protein C1S79_19625 [Mycolicibacterium phocaicum]
MPIRVTLTPQFYDTGIADAASLPLRWVVVNIRDQVHESGSHKRVQPAFCCAKVIRRGVEAR